jgi:hypothetical protein
MSALQLIKIRQHFSRPRLEDVPATVVQELEQMKPLIKSGMRVAIAAGSRGIANIATIIKTVVDFVRVQGGEPFIIPAMGSHGGGTAEGQAGVLASYGITEATIGAPVRSSLDTVEIPAEGMENRVFMDRFAYESDGVILVNRVKVHTDFHGPHESGLVKMSVIGLGKHRQALEIHRFGVYGLRHLIPLTAKRIFETGKVLFGVALVENAYDETMSVKALQANEILAQEPTQEYDNGIVMESLQKGYRLGDRVIRTAKVKVAINDNDKGNKTHDTHKQVINFWKSNCLKVMQ